MELNNKNNKEEELIDQKDLIIINEPKNWEPTQKQILAYAKQLGFIDSDPKELLQIAYKYLKKAIPSNLLRAFKKVDNRLLYIDKNKNEIHLSSDIEDYAKNELLQFKEEYKRKNEIEKEVKVTPRKKIPPINQNSDNLQKLNLINEKDKLQFHFQDKKIDFIDSNLNKLNDIDSLKYENNKLNLIIVDLNHTIKQLNAKLIDSNNKLNEETKNYQELKKEYDKINHELKRKSLEYSEIEKNYKALLNSRNKNK